MTEQELASTFALFDKLKNLVKSDTERPQKRRDLVVLLLAVAQDVYSGYLEESEDQVASIEWVFRDVVEDESQN